MPRWFVIVGFAVVVLGLAHRPSPGQEFASWFPPVKEVSRRYADALTRRDASACQAVTTTQLWSRLGPRLASGTNFGTVEALDSGNQVRQGLAYMHLLCTHPDGVSDVVTITLVQVGSEWKVAGGPCGATPP